MANNYNRESQLAMKRLEANLRTETFFKLRVLLTLLCREHQFPEDGITTVLAWIELSSLLTKEGSSEVSIIHNEIMAATQTIDQQTLETRLNDMRAILEL
tara:strand:+ start:32228 stop:32527 length:300 start_codon:yes stop_codon:yes gene_type:complete